MNVLIIFLSIVFKMSAESDKGPSCSGYLVLFDPLSKNQIFIRINYDGKVAKHIIFRFFGQKLKKEKIGESKFNFLLMNKH